MIPPLDDHGLLPPGVHVCNLREVHAMFVSSARRDELWQKLITFLKLLRDKSLMHPIYLAGGFISGKDWPDDIDLVHDLTRAPEHDQFLGWKMFSQARDLIKETHNIDYCPNLSGNNDFSAYLQYIGPKAAAATGLHEKSPRGVLSIGDPYAELD